MSVAFIVSDRVESDPGWPVAAEGTWDDSRFVIQRNPTAMPRAYVVPRATVLPGSSRRGAVVARRRSTRVPRSSMTADPLAGSHPARASRSRPPSGPRPTPTALPCS